MRFTISCIFLIILIALGSSFTISYSEKVIPDWVKNTAGWWSDDQISEQEFVSAIEFLIEINVIDLNNFPQNVISNLLTWDEIVNDAKFANDGSLKIKEIHFGDSDIMLTTKFDAMSNNFLDVTTFDLLDSGINLFKIEPKKDFTYST